MKLQSIWSRRTFLSTAAMTGAVAATAKWKTDAAAKTEAASLAGKMAFVGFADAAHPENDRVESYRVVDGKWLSAGVIAAEKPTALAVHPTGPVVYVTHGTELFRNLPSGSVTAIGVGADGAMTPMGREGTALSATMPDHVAVSPDGRSMLVSASKGGSYNHFKLAADGAVMATPMPLKETGAGPHPMQSGARPHTIVYSADGLAAYASDFGTDRINHLSLTAEAPAVAGRISLAPGSGPAEMALHPSGRFLVVSNRLRASLSVLPIDRATGNLMEPTHHHALGTEFGGPIAMNESGNRVYVASEKKSGEMMVSTFGFSRTGGRLQLLQQSAVSGLGNVGQMVRVNGQLLLTGSNGVVSMAIDRQSGQLGEANVVLRKAGVTGLAVRTV